MNSIVEALSCPDAYPQTSEVVEVVETHISWVFLTGSFAYKVKKPLDLGFLDFSTLEKRRHYCNEEIRLNRRLCPEIYLSVVPVVRAGESLLVDAPGEIIDYAVKMVQFDRTMELDRMLAQQLLREEHIDCLATLIAGFHSSLPAVAAESGFGHPDNIVKPMLHNFTTLESIICHTHELNQLSLLQAYTMQEHRRLYSLLLKRKSDGFIRQCHGDLHTGNMVLWKERIFIFDCIEFNEAFSTIDVISDLAFLFMNLEHGGESGLAWRLLNHYLAETGDFEALPLLRFYALYRAMVRAKVTAIRFSQSEGPEAERILEERGSYIARAQSYTCTKKPMLILTFGVSGSGKTLFSRSIAEALRCIHIRSDIERKRLAGLKALERSEENRSLYANDSSQKTYRRLLDLALLCIEAGITVIVDATFLKGSNRQMFIKIAEAHHTPCRILRFSAPDAVLIERVRRRYQRGDDASEADTRVVRLQLGMQEALTVEEEAITLDIDSTEQVDGSAIASRLQSVTA
ncbi:MAG: hypothetical protein FDX02_01895 [Chlorobium sp.]|nr:MAG: hypothetical protein FDX02_01895 [Chlorobium sp.]